MFQLCAVFSKIFDALKNLKPKQKDRADDDAKDVNRSLIEVDMNYTELHPHFPQVAHPSVTVANLDSG